MKDYAFPGEVTMTSVEYLEMVDRIRELDSQLYFLQEELKKVKEALATAEKKLAEDNF